MHTLASGIEKQEIAEFIAHAPYDIEYLLRELAATRAELKELEQTLLTSQHTAHALESLDVSAET